MNAQAKDKTQQQSGREHLRRNAAPINRYGHIAATGR